MKELSYQSFAVIYPVPKKITHRILHAKKSVFTKYPTHEILSPKLKSCKKLLFYVSGSNKEIAGEADIVSIDLMILSEVLSKYRNNLFLTENELREYSNGRDTKNMMVFILDNITTYSEHKYLGHGITMVGEYISKEEYEFLVGGQIEK